MERVAGCIEFMEPGQPRYRNDRRETRRHRGLQQRHWPYVTQSATMLRRMLVRVFRSEGCRLRANQRAEKEQHEQPLRFAANVDHLAHYTQPGQSPTETKRGPPVKGPSGNQ